LACVLFECLTGRLPYPVGDTAAKVAAHLLQPPPSPSLFVPTITPALDAVVLRGMAKTPGRRYGTSTALVSAAEAGGPGSVVGMYVKLCGLRTEADVAVAVDAGADAVGFVFTPSARQVDLDTAKRLVAAVPPGVLTVGVFAGVAASEAGDLAVAAGVGAVQLHGDYPSEAFAELANLPVDLVRATALRADTDLRVGAYGERYLLLDSPVPGSGHRWELDALATRPDGPWLLAGGLDVANVADAVTRAQPWGVDVSSGIESSRGVKDHGLMRDFVAAARLR
jgi:phosphoribosylanthranilate isomerase